MKKIILGLVTLLLTSGVISAEANTPQTAHPGVSIQDTVRGTEQTPFIVKVQPPQNAQENDAKDEAVRNEKAIEDKILTWATVALAICTAGLWFATYRLGAEAQKESTRQAEEIKKSLEIARASAKAARDSVETMKSNAEMELRAYVSSNPDWIYSFDKKNRARMRYTITNHGKTTAYNLRHAAAVDIFPYPLPPGFAFPDTTILSASVSLFVGQSFFGSIEADRLFAQSEIDACVANNGFRIYCYGIVEYESFGEKRTTRFCRSIVGSDNLRKVSSNITKDLDITYEIAATNNDSN